MAACVTDGRGAMTDENIRTIVHTALTSLMAAVTAHYRNTDMACKKAAKMCSRAELVAENSPLSLPDWPGEIFERSAQGKLFGARSIPASEYGASPKSGTRTLEMILSQNGYGG